MKTNLVSPEISVIIPTYRDWDRLTICLEHLGLQSCPADSFEVIVVNNDAAQDVPSALLEQFPSVIFLTEPKPGSYAARNLALVQAKGDVVAFTDSDCRPSPRWLETGLRRLRSEPAVDRLAGNIAIVVSEKRTAGELYDYIFGFPQRTYVSQGFCATANLICRTALFDAVGPFDNQLMSGGDYEWNLRATERGFSIEYMEDMEVAHPARGRSEILQKARRVYAKTFTLESKSFLRRFVDGIALLRPPFRHLSRVWRISPTELSLRDKWRVMGIIMIRRYVEVSEHFRLLFGGKARRV